MSKNKEPLIVDGINVSKCYYVIDYDPPEWQGTWGGAIHKGACRVYSKDCKDNPNCYFKQLARKTQIIDGVEEVIKPYQEQIELDALSLPIAIESILERKTQECEELKKEIINKDEKIKELRFSVSDLTNRLCFLNAEKSFRIVDLEQTLDEIKKELKEDLYCESQECGCDDFEECLKCTKEHILDIINKTKGEGNE